MLENGDVWPKFEDGIAAAVERERERRKREAKRIPLSFLPLEAKSGDGDHPLMTSAVTAMEEGGGQ